MKSFVEYVTEETASANPTFEDIKPTRVERHWQRYVVAKRKDGNKPQFQLARDIPTAGFKAGDSVHVASKNPTWKTIKVNGKERQVAHTTIEHPKTGAKTTVRLSHIHSEPGKKIGRFNDEHAFVSMGNYAMQHNITSASEMHRHVALAQHNPKHPLHFKNVSNDKFYGSVKNHKSEASYYNEMHDVTGTIEAMANHPTFAKHWNSKSSLNQMGASSYKVHDSFDNKTRTVVSKADVAHFVADGKKIGTISLKHGPAQAMSGGAADTTRVYHHAIQSLGVADDHPLHKHVKKLQKLLSRPNHSKEDFAEINAHIEKMHKSHPDLGKAVYSTAMKGPYLPKEGQAQYVAATPIHTDAARKRGAPLKPSFFGTVDKYVEHVHKKSKGTIPRAWPGKTSSMVEKGEPSVRLTTPG